MYDIIFSDYDFTLYGESHKISEKTKNSIKKYLQSGGKFVISTGRIYASIRNVALDLTLDGDIITSQGSQIYNLATDSEVLTKYVDKQKTLQILDFARNNGCLAQCYAGNKIYADKDKKYNEFFTSFFDVPLIESDCIYDDIKEDKIKPNKFELLLDENRVDGVIKYLAKEYPMFLFSKSAPMLIEIVRKDATKGKAVEFLLDKYNIAKENALAIGDGNNDIDMLNAVGGKCAVGSSKAKRLLSVADYITKDVSGDGVSEVIELVLAGKDIK